MSLFDKFQKFAEARQAMEENHSDFFNIVMEDICFSHRSSSERAPDTFGRDQ